MKVTYFYFFVISTDGLSQEEKVKAEIDRETFIDL
jgi:hypothetical protein